MASKTAWGLEIAQTAVRAVKVQRQKHQAEILEYAVYPIDASPDDPDWQVKALDLVDAWIDEYNIGKTPVVLSFPALPGFVPLFRDFFIPAVKESKLREIVMLEAKQQIPYPLEDVLWDFYCRDGDEDSGELGISLVCCRRDIIEAMLEFLEETGLNISAIQVGPVGLVNFLMYDQPPEKPVLLLDSGARGTEFIVINNDAFWLRPISTGGTMLTRELMQKFSIDYNDASTLKHQLAESKQADRVFQVLVPTLRQLSGEIQRSLGFYKSIYRGVQIEQTFCAGGSFLLNGFDQFLADNLGMSVTGIRELQYIATGPDVDEDALKAELPRLGTCIGLALQGIGEAPIPINLLPPEIIRERTISAKLPFTIAAVCLLLLMTVVSHFTVSDKLVDHKDLLQVMVNTNNAVTQKQQAYNEAKTPFKAESEKNLRLAHVAINRGDMRAATSRVLEVFSHINQERTKRIQELGFQETLYQQIIESPEVTEKVAELTTVSEKRPKPYDLALVMENVKKEVTFRAAYVTSFYRRVLLQDVHIQSETQTWYREKEAPWRVVTPAMKNAMAKGQESMAFAGGAPAGQPAEAPLGELIAKDVPVVFITVKGISVSDNNNTADNQMYDASAISNDFKREADFCEIHLVSETASRLETFTVLPFVFEPEISEDVVLEEMPLMPGPMFEKGKMANASQREPFYLYGKDNSRRGLPSIEFTYEMSFISERMREAVAALIAEGREEGAELPSVEKVLHDEKFSIGVSKKPDGSTGASKRPLFNKAFFGAP